METSSKRSSGKLAENAWLIPMRLAILIGPILGMIIGLYVLFQVRRYYF